MNALANRALIVAFVAFVALSTGACTPGSLVGRLEQEVWSRLIASTGLQVSESQPRRAGQEEGPIQDVIQRANAAQEEAISSGDPTVMRDTSTERYYREISEVNQDLLNAGVTSIRLLNIEWGPIRVTGNTAVATAWETWRVTLRDGSSRQSRDRNIYRLVLQDGSWKIESDDHPDEQPPIPPGIQT